MKQSFVIIVALFPAIVLSQNSEWELGKKSKELEKTIDNFPFDHSASPDTIFYFNSKIKAIGCFFRDDQTKMTYRIGHWTEFYENGTLKSEGNYQIQIYPACCAIPCTIHNSYKIGEWKYYYETGDLKASGKYSLTKRRINTGRKNVSVIRSKVKGNWLLFDQNGIPIHNDSQFVQDLEMN